ncbi:MAG TPA: hypothetical protein VHY76_03190, partial [Acetobacteraceae bacterium]|nr:hypothetical protein [Acetobacteraceae bacterium]
MTCQQVLDLNFLLTHDRATVEDGQKMEQAIEYANGFIASMTAGRLGDETYETGLKILIGSCDELKSQSI